MINKTESEIIKNWQGDHAIPVVSVCCITFNHENYISQAIDSFLEQETNFPFEILIHDDASTDGTTEIVKKYQDDFPNIIKTVIQTENQYSKHPIMAPRFLYPIARGKYIALCEGDDYWIADYKLQKQVNFLNNNNKYSMYAHAVQVVDEVIVKKPFYPNVKWNKEKNNFLDVLNNHFIPTPSLLFRNELVDFPFSGLKSVGLLAGDMAIELFMASKGFCYYDTEVMGVYRNHDDGITKNTNRNYEKDILHNITLYSKINECTNYKYKKHINQKLCDVYVFSGFVYFKNKEYKKMLIQFKNGILLGKYIFIKTLLIKVPVKTWKYVLNKFSDE